MEKASFTIPIPRKHSCGTDCEERYVHIRKGYFNKPDYPIDYCPKCELYTYHHGKNGKRGIEARNPEEVAKYIEDLIS